MEIEKAKEIVSNYFMEWPKDDLVALAMEHYGDEELIELAKEIESEE